MFSPKEYSVTLRRFEQKDVPNKVKWINTPENNRFLHYDLPLEIQKTLEWFNKNANRTDRYDAVIEVDGLPVGIIGLLSIDTKNKKAEYYITLGEASYKGKGVASKASLLLLEHAFEQLGLNKVYLFTETENVPAQKLFEKLGFEKEGCLKSDLYYNDRFVDRIAYGMTLDKWENITCK